eukprot:2164572-Karenia_brevis.AAC.1
MSTEAPGPTSRDKRPAEAASASAGQSTSRRRRLEAGPSQTPKRKAELGADEHRYDVEQDETSLLAYLEPEHDRIIANIIEKAKADGNPYPVCEESDPWDRASTAAGGESEANDPTRWDSDSCWDLYLDDISSKILDNDLV